MSHLPNILASLIVFILAVESGEQPPVVPLGTGQTVEPLPVPRPPKQPVTLSGLLKEAKKKSISNFFLDTQ